MSRKKTHDEYVEDLRERGISIKVIGQYITANTPILHECPTSNRIKDSIAFKIYTRLN